MWGEYQDWLESLPMLKWIGPLIIFALANEFDKIWGLKTIYMMGNWCSEGHILE